MSINLKWFFVEKVRLSRFWLFVSILFWNKANGAALNPWIDASSMFVFLSFCANAVIYFPLPLNFYFAFLIDAYEREKNIPILISIKICALTFKSHAMDYGMYQNVLFALFFFHWMYSFRLCVVLFSFSISLFIQRVDWCNFNSIPMYSHLNHSAIIACVLYIYATYRVCLCVCVCKRWVKAKRIIY